MKIEKDYKLNKTYNTNSKIASKYIKDLNINSKKIKKEVVKNKEYEVYYDKEKNTYYYINTSKYSMHILILKVYENSNDKCFELKDYILNKLKIEIN